MNIERQAKQIANIMVTMSLWATVGCSQSLAFKVVDAKTLKPLAGAETIIDTENMAYSGYVDIVRRGGGTDSGGTITIDNLRSDGLWRTSVLFSRLGYYDAGARIGRGDRNTIMLMPSRDPKIESIPERASPGIIIVKMYPATEGDVDTELDGWTDDPHWNKGGKR